MTSKELLYVEDALGHEKYFQTKCMEAAAQMQDEDLKQCVTDKLWCAIMCLLNQYN